MVRVSVWAGAAVALWAVAVGPAQAASGDDSYFCAAADRARAIVSCTRIIEDKGQSEAAQELALRNRAFSYQAVGDFDHAIGDYDTLLALSPDHPSQYVDDVRP